MKKQNVTFSHHNQASACIASREETSLHLAQQLNTHANLYFSLTVHLHHIYKNYFHVLMVFKHVFNASEVRVILCLLFVLCGFFELETQVYLACFGFPR